MRKPAILALLSAVGAAQAGVGITSELYLTAGDQRNIWVVQGNGVNNSWTMNSTGREYPIAVAGDVRTLGGLNPEIGSQYTLGGTFTGTTYAWPAAVGSAWDGTTNGANNFVVDFDNATLVQLDTDWTNASVLFNLGTATNYLGITFDFTDNSFWVSGWSLGIVEHYSMAGAFLGAFVTPFNNISSLALDHATGTLWMGSQSQQGTFFQYSKAGVAMGSVNIPLLNDQNTLGGEFQAVPEPATFVVLGFGLVALVRSRRK